MRYIGHVVTLELDVTRCTGCARCVAVCPHGVFAMGEGLAHIVDRDACMECGACRLNCAFGAIEVESGVGCASALIAAALRGSSDPSCGQGGGCC